ncbi:unnamed protein product [Adineta ricciae]|uniref:G-protein coupled receptors family 1 profile domain-containing protein n=1 Tax=Adineta ricciae TaxID=249248 RepID=A0A815TLM1_ADIRI|nr:unnamed protein product [Adineta ricciae]CAF1503736.1 unnamed protein product [Adineta ricciae]
MVDLKTGLAQFNIYTGILLMIIGIFGNISNMIVFCKTNLQHPTTYILFCTSCASLSYLSIGLFTRVITTGFLIDWTTMNMSWCRARLYFAHVIVLSSVCFTCYASINQFFSTSQKEKLRRLSNLTRARYATFLILVTCFLHHLPLAILAQQIPNGTGGVVCNPVINPYLRGYISYFIVPFVLSLIPVTFLIIVGALTYHNVSMLQGTNSRQRAQRHLVSMILLQTVSITIGSLPYGLQSLYSAITTYVVKDSNRKVVEDAIFQIVNTTYYIPHAFSFFIYLISSATFRDQVKTILHLSPKENRVTPF